MEVCYNYLNMDEILPWMDKKEIDVIEKYLKDNTIMLEWGAGGSTTYFSKRVKKLCSIEHNESFYNEINNLNLKNVNLLFCPPNKIVPQAESDFESYKDYIECATKFGEKFDVILIDGRARLECAKFAINLLNDNGIVLVHDFWKAGRERYRPILDYYEEIESIKDTVQTIIVLKKI